MPLKFKRVKKNKKLIKIRIARKGNRFFSFWGDSLLGFHVYTLELGELNNSKVPTTNGTWVVSASFSLPFSFTLKNYSMLYGALIGAAVGLIGYAVSAIIKKNKKE